MNGVTWISRGLWSLPWLQPASSSLYFHILQHLFLLSFTLFISLFSSLLGLPLPSFSLFLSLISTILSFVSIVSLVSLHSHAYSLCFVSHFVLLFPTWLSEDLVTLASPKPTKARRFLLPFVFCSDSPPNGILSPDWMFRKRSWSTKLRCGRLKHNIWWTWVLRDLNLC